MTAKQIQLILICSAMFSILVIVTLVGAMAFAMDSLAQQQAVRLMANAVSSHVETNAALTLDYGEGGDAYHWVTSRDDVAVRNNIGTNALNGPVFDEIYIADANGAPLYAFKRGGIGSDPSIVDQTVARTFYARAQAEVDPSNYKVVSSFAMVKGKLSIVSAGRIHPHDRTGLDGRTVPVLITVEVFDENTTTTITNNLFLESKLDLVLTPVTQTERGIFTLPLTDGSQTLAHLRWPSTPPSVAALKIIGPPLAVLSIVLLGGSLLAGYYIRRKASDLADARRTAETDPLTGLLNRHGFMLRAQSAKVKTALAKGQIAVFYMDLNGFKGVNDGAGHEWGDNVLVLVAKKFREEAAPTDILVRYGGDEFLLITLNETSEDILAQRGKRLSSAIQTELTIGDRIYNISASVGIAVGIPGDDMEALLQNADSAMFTAKRYGGGWPVFHHGKDNVSRMGQIPQTTLTDALPSQG